MTRTTSHGRRALAAACGLALALGSAQAADARLGELDPAFDGDGVALPDVGVAPTGDAQFEAVATRPGGAPLAAGWVESGANPEAVVAQLTPAGALDATFGAGGIARIPATGFATRLHGVALAPGGRVLGAGDRRATTAPPDQAVPALLPFSADGTPEPPVQIGFDVGEAHAVAPLADGKVLVAGWRNPDGAGDVFMVARLNANGSLDQTFGDGDGIAEVSFGASVPARALAMAVDPSGRPVLAGWAFIGGITVPAFARFDVNGTVNGTETFTPAISNPSGQTGGLINDVQVDALGRITAAGFSGASYALTVRLVAGGTPDPGFGNGGMTFGAINESAGLEGLALDGDRALVAGSAGPGRGPQHLLLGALDGAGVPDAGLGGAPIGWRTFALGTSSSALDVALGAGGSVYTAGVIGTPSRPFVSRHLPNAAPAATLAAAAQATAGAPVTFDAGGSTDPEGEALRFAFDLDGNGSYELDGGGNPFAARSFPAAGTYTVGVRVTDPRGASATAARTVAVAAAPVPPPRPVLGKQGVARPIRGIVRVRLPGTKRFVRLTELTAIPNGTEIDARKGRVLIAVLHDASGRLDAARFYAGRFFFKQGRGATPITTLKLSGGSFRACRATKRKARRSVLAVASRAAGKGKKRVRKLWGDGRGRFRTRGKYGAATVRGTKWLTQDRCDGTRIKVKRGKVDVADLVRPKRKAKRLNSGDAILIRKAR